MRSIIISDLHNRTSWIDPFLETQEYDEVVFLGDHFDNYGDGPFIAEKTAQWLKEALVKYKAKGHFLFGNHDLAYAFPLNKHFACSGNTRDKAVAIRRIIKQEDWKQFKLCHYTQGFLCSHAGITARYLKHELEANIEYIEAQCKKSLHLADTVLYLPLLGAGNARGGLQPIGGIVWCDWNKEFEPIPNINQIVGHTIDTYVRENSLPNSKNYCIDTNNLDVGIIEDGKFSWIDSPLPPIKKVPKLWK